MHKLPDPCVLSREWGRFSSAAIKRVAGRNLIVPCQTLASKLFKIIHPASERVPSLAVWSSDFFAHEVGSSILSIAREKIVLFLQEETAKRGQNLRLCKTHTYYEQDHCYEGFFVWLKNEKFSFQALDVLGSEKSVQRSLGLFLPNLFCFETKLLSEECMSTWKKLFYSSAGKGRKLFYGVYLYY